MVEHRRKTRLWTHMDTKSDEKCVARRPKGSFFRPRPDFGPILAPSRSPRWVPWADFRPTFADFRPLLADFGFSPSPGVLREAPGVDSGCPGGPSWAGFWKDFRCRHSASRSKCCPNSVPSLPQFSISLSPFSCFLPQTRPALQLKGRRSRGAF